MSILQCFIILSKSFFNDSNRLRMFVLTECKINAYFVVSELRKAKKDLESMKSQAENVATEYDRLMAEKDKLERQLRIAGGGEDNDKKDD